MYLKTKDEYNNIELHSIGRLSYDIDIFCSNDSRTKPVIHGISFVNATTQEAYYIPNVSYEDYLVVSEELFTNGKCDVSHLGTTKLYDDDGESLFGGLFK